MIVNCDGKALEWVAGTFLNQDKVAMQEIWDGVDQHSLNQEAFKLPERLIAKKFVFRLIFGGSAYTYAKDLEFNHVSTSPKYWQNVIDKFCEKYYGWDGWWGDLIREASTTGRIVNPYTGRFYNYKSNEDGTWPVTTIKNYIVQGFAADLMAIARTQTRRRFAEEGIKGVLISTVHDSIVADVEADEVERMNALFLEVFADIPRLFKLWFGHEFNLPVRCEVSYGPNMKELIEI
jgi:DNA polymerase I-like protein with 3'-5' exonuclease and polymerase domains